MIGELALAASMALSPTQCATCGPGGGMEFSPGSASGSWVAGAGGGGNPYDSVSAGGGGGGDQLYPFDSPEPWLHGWFQEIPAYGGYHTFRPHNYKHVLAQMEVGGRWGMSPMMPYSHQWYHPYRQRAGMHPDFGAPQASYSPNGRYDVAGNGPVMMAASAENAAPAELQQVGAIQRGYTGTAIPGIATPYYQQPLAMTSPTMPQPNREANERWEALQKQIEQQTFQLQLLQEQLRNQPQTPQPLMPWQVPNYAQFPEYQQQMGYQELPAPNAQLNPAPQQPIMSPGYGDSGTMQPGYPQAPAQPALMFPQSGYPAQQQLPIPQAMPGYNNPRMPQNVPLLNAPNMNGMMIPQGQAYFSQEQAVPMMNQQMQGYSGGLSGNMHATHIAPVNPAYQGASGYGQQQGMPLMNQGVQNGYALPSPAAQPMYFPQGVQAQPAQQLGNSYRPLGRY